MGASVADTLLFNPQLPDERQVINYYFKDIAMGINLTKYSLTIPELSDQIVPRNDWTTWIRGRFSRQKPILILQGPDGAGKTTLLAQFARHFSEQCVSFFIKPDQYISSPQSFYRELCLQMQVALEGKESNIPSDFYELKQLFGDLYYKLGRRASKTRPYYFVIDGLEWISESIEQESIINLLPKHLYPNTYLLASARSDQRFNFDYESISCPLFSEIAVKDYFKRSDLDIDHEDANTIYEICHMPGYLDQLRREMQTSKKPLHEVLEDLPEGFRELLERSWANIEINDETTKNIFALLAHSKVSLEISSLAEMLGVKEQAIIDRLTSTSITQLEPRIGFVTDAHKQFVVDKLHNRRSWVEQVLISYYSRDQYEDQSLEHLPVLLKETNNYKSLKKLITIEHLVRTLQTKQSMYLLRRNVQLVTEAAKAQQDWQTLAKYVMASGILRKLSTEPVQKSELEALLALNDYQKSFALANQAILPEDKLQFLAHIGSRMKQQGEKTPSSILSTIEGLVNQIDPDEITKERMTEIVVDLFYVHHQAAETLVDKITGTEIDVGGRSADLLLAMLAVQLEGEAENYADNLRSQINEKKLRDFTRAHSQIVAGLSTEEVLSELQKIEDTSYKLFQLRSWCNSNRDNCEAITVIREAVKIMKGASANPSMRHLRQFAEPLLACKKDEIGELIEDFDLLKSTALKKPAEELVRLELLLARVEANRNMSDKATERLYEMYFYLDEIDQLDVRCYSLVRMLLSLPDIDSEDIELQDEIEKRLEEEYKDLLSVSADHYSLTRRLLSPLTNYNPNKAVDFSQQLNSHYRRESALSKILIIYSDRESDSLDLAFLDNNLQKISHPDIRDWTLVGG